MNKSLSVLLFLAFFLLLSVCSFCRFGVSLRSLELMLLAGVSSAAAVSDLQTRRIPDRLVLAGILLRIMFLCITSFVPQQGSAGPGYAFPAAAREFAVRELFSALLISVLTALILSVPVLFLVLLADRLLNKETLGGGDLKLIFMLGLYCDLRTGLYGLLYGCGLGALTLLVFTALQKKDRAFPFGPALVLGFFFAILF